MSRARSAVAVRTTLEKFREASINCFAVTPLEQGNCDDFDDVIDFCRPHTELLGGEPGQDAWYFFKKKDWIILGDLGLTLWSQTEALEKLSAELGEVVVAALDDGFAFAHFSVYKDGRVRRRLMLEDDEVTMEGLPVPAERGRHRTDFDLEDAEQLWTSYGLPTFEYDPEEGPFSCISLTLPDA